MTQKPARTSPSNDAATAFEGLRREISLQRTAIEGLTAAKDKLPDYSLTLRAMDERLDRIDERLHRIDQHPALQLTPLTMAAQMFEASQTCRAEDRKAIGRSEERRVGNGCVTSCRSRWSPCHYKKQDDN